MMSPGKENCRTSDNAAVFHGTNLSQADFIELNPNLPCWSVFKLLQESEIRWRSLICVAFCFVTL